MRNLIFYIIILISVNCYAQLDSLSSSDKIEILNKIDSLYKSDSKSIFCHFVKIDNSIFLIHDCIKCDTIDINNDTLLSKTCNKYNFNKETIIEISIIMTKYNFIAVGECGLGDCADCCTFITLDNNPNNFKTGKNIVYSIYIVNDKKSRCLPDYCFEKRFPDIIYSELNSQISLIKSPYWLQNDLWSYETEWHSKFNKKWSNKNKNLLKKETTKTSTNLQLVPMIYNNSPNYILEPTNR